MADSFHRTALEGKSAIFAVAVTIGISVGAIVELVPLFTVGTQPMPGVTAYTPLEQAGRDIYVREGCYNCHSQMVRPMEAETLRYGEWTRAGELVYDHPFQLGSRRIGPDLQRVGGKYPDAWHYEHMRDPRSTSPGSIMPTYTWLYEQTVDPDDVQASVNALAKLGSGYDTSKCKDDLKAQQQKIAESLKAAGDDVNPDKEIVALISYLQRLGKDGKAAISAAKAKGEVL